MTSLPKFFLIASFVLPAVRMTAQTVVDTTIAMDDQVVLDALYALPEASPPSTGWPVIIWIHGFNESKEDVRENVRESAQDGYASFGFSVRGQGNSGGVFDFFTSERIQADLRSVIACAKNLPRVNADRVGIVGASQGGLLAWAAAVYAMGIRTAVSRICNGRFDEDWSANNTLNWTFTRSVALTQVRLEPAFRDSVNAAAQSGNHAFVSSWLASHSTAGLESGVTVPVAMFLSYHDGYFSPNAALRQFARIAAPKRIILYPGGHTQPQNPDQRAFVDIAQKRWLAYWLKDDDGSRMPVDSSVIFFDAGTGAPHVLPLSVPGYWLAAADPLPEGVTPRTWYLAPAGLSETPVVAAGSRTNIYTNLLGSSPLSFRSDPFPEDAIVAGTFGTAVLHTDGSARQYQVNLVLYDADLSTGETVPLSRGQSERVHNVAGQRDTFHLELNTTMHTIRRGHAIEARIHTGIAIAPNPLTDFGNYVLGPPFNSTNTVYFGGETPSSFTLHFIDPSVLSGGTDRPAPSSSGLLACYPNPFNPAITLRYNVPATSRVRITIVDVLGRPVATLVDAQTVQGIHTVGWDAGRAPGGAYFVRFNSGRSETVRGIVLVR